jgi:4'-phosphopantetheinyl transferase
VSRSLRTRVLRWPSADAARIGDADVKVYTASLLAGEAELERAAKLLSRAERSRLSGYSNEVVARRFAVGRAVLREVLGALQSLAPSAVRLVEGEFGKPALLKGAGAIPLWFSVAHCDDLLLVALSREGEVGVDVERTRPIDCWQRVAERTLAPAERSELLRAVERGEEPDRVVLRHWCRVEAELKAIGCGIQGLDAHRAGERPAGMRVADLTRLPLPNELAATGVRYEAAVALCPVSDSDRQARRATSQQATPSTAPTRASTP